jgi:hypothetical protein
MSDVELVPESTQSLPRPYHSEGLLSWISTIDHKQIGIMYLNTFANLR